MKKFTFFFLFIFFSTFLMAQNAPKQREIGITFGDLSKNNYGIVYSVGTQKSMWRFSTLYVSGNTQNLTSTNFDYQGNQGDESTSKITNVGLTLAVGREFIKSLNNHVEFRYGPNVSFGFSYNHLKNYTNQQFSSENKTITTQYTPGLGFIVALDYEISKHFLAGLEYIPGISYSFNGVNYFTDNIKTQSTTNQFFNWSANNQSGGHLILIYRF